MQALSKERGRSTRHETAWRSGMFDYHDQLRAFYEPLDKVKQRLKDGDVSAAEDALTFLTADPWCFRSGYMKRDHIDHRRLQEIVLQRVANPQPGLLRVTARLAAAVWDESLDSRLCDVAALHPQSSAVGCPIDAATASGYSP